MPPQQESRYSSLSKLEAQNLPTCSESLHIHNTYLQRCFTPSWVEQTLSKGDKDRELPKHKNRNSFLVDCINRGLFNRVRSLQSRLRLDMMPAWDDVADSTEREFLLFKMATMNLGSSLTELLGNGDEKSDDVD
jgi:hypothetical protein